MDRNSPQVPNAYCNYEIRNDFDIATVNMSLGGASVHTTVCSFDPRAQSIFDLWSEGVFAVIATGNGGVTDTISAPACVPQAIRVGVTTDNDNVADFSNVADFMTFFAPGVDVVSSVPGGGTLSIDRTSMAPPHVAGTMALMRQRIDDMPASLKARLKAGDPIQRLLWARRSGMYRGLSDRA